jgi:hypothetical protein
MCDALLSVLIGTYEAKMRQKMLLAQAERLNAIS